jgi:hypothetical protein
MEELFRCRRCSPGRIRPNRRASPLALTEHSRQLHVRKAVAHRHPEEGPSGCPNAAVTAQPVGPSPRQGMTRLNGCLDSAPIDELVQPTRLELAVARLAVTFATSRKLGVPSLR